MVKTKKTSEDIALRFVKRNIIANRFDLLLNYQPIRIKRRACLRTEKTNSLWQPYFAQPNSYDVAAKVICL